MEHSPSLQILLRGPAGFTIWKGPTFIEGKPQVRLENVACSTAKFSDNGSRLMLIKESSIVSIYDCANFTEIRRFDVPSVLSASLSPCGTYLQTFQKPSAPQEKNVNIWSVETGSSVYHISMKNMSIATWPAIQFSSDESVASRLCTNEIQIFDGNDFSKGVIRRIRVPGVAAMQLSRADGSHIAAFVAESKGMPASVQIFACKGELAQPVARRSFFRCSTAQLFWNCLSSGLLILAQSDVDKTNQSYYGESKLNYLTTDGSHEGLVALRKEGPVHDVQWSSSGLEFAVVYGFMPARATVFDKKCNPILELGSGPYNTIRFNPKGKLLCLAGFGNLPGDMAFWDYSNKKHLGNTKAECSVTSEWSPDGRYFMTATTAPRLQIDNGIKIFSANGTLYFSKMFDRLYQVDWKPEDPEKFSDISDVAQSLGTLKIDDSKKQGLESKPAPQSSKPVAVPTQKPAAYRPPHSKSAAAVQAELFGLAPSEEASKNAARNKKRREKKKAAGASSSLTTS
ncbi:eukaryotic translation initiation factor eIF2A family protein [Wolffia australiana]